MSDLTSEPTLANKTRSSFGKRQKEVARQTRRKEKDAKRLEAKQKKAEGGTDAGGSGEDPDLAGIVPGPQPRAWEGGDAAPEEESGDR